MLRLRHQVTCDEHWIALLADEHSFGRTSQELNGTIEGNQPLGCGHVPITRTDNLVHARDAFSPIGQSSNSLRSTHAVEFAHAEKCRSSQSRLGRARRYNTN